MCAHFCIGSPCVYCHPRAALTGPPTIVINLKDGVDPAELGKAIADAVNRWRT